AHLGVKQAHGIVGRVIRPEGVGADEFRQLLGLVCFGTAYRAHFMNDNGDASLGNLPGSFRAGETAADNVNGFVCHALEIGGTARKCNANCSFLTAGSSKMMMP